MNEPFKNFAGIAAVLPRRNIDTDAIIPSAWLRSHHADLAKGLFARERFDDAGREVPDFVLNREPFRAASILVCGENFGCGSSREAAVWALKRYGIRAVIAASFADIFYENAFRNGLLPAIVDATEVERLMALITDAPGVPVLQIDIEDPAVVGPDGRRVAVHVPEDRRNSLRLGLDQIAETLAHESAIASFEQRYRAAFPELYRPIEKNASA